LLFIPLFSVIVIETEEAIMFKVTKRDLRYKSRVRRKLKTKIYEDKFL
jgi:hypothetical protein